MLVNEPLRQGNFGMMAVRKQNENPLHQGLSKPAQRALTNAGITTPAQLAKHGEAQIAALHGMGPTGVAALKRALAANGKKFAKKG